LELQNPVGSLQEKTAQISSEAINNINSEAFLDKLMIKEKLNALPPRERQIIVLRYILEKSQEEVARLLGLSQSHISRLERQSLKIIKEKNRP